MRSTDTASVCEFIQRDIIGRHGCPRDVISDNGTAFTSKRFDHFCRQWRIRHVLTTPYHPQANGLVERLNKTLKSVLSAYVNPAHKDWDDKVPLAAFAINSARQSTTRYTPFELLYGRSPALPIEYVFPSVLDPPESLRQRAIKLQVWFEEARRHISARQLSEGGNEARWADQQGLRTRCLLPPNKSPYPV